VEEEQEPLRPRLEGCDAADSGSVLLEELRRRYEGGGGLTTEAQSREARSRAAADDVRRHMDVICAQLMESPLLEAEVRSGLGSAMARNSPVMEEVRSVCRRLFDDDAIDDDDLSSARSYPTADSDIKFHRSAGRQEAEWQSDIQTMETEAARWEAEQATETVAARERWAELGAEQELLQLRRNELAELSRKAEHHLQAECAAVQSRQRRAEDLEQLAREKLAEAAEEMKRVRAREDELAMRQEVQDTREGAWQLQQRDRQETEARCTRREAAVARREAEMAEKEVQITRRLAEIEERERALVERERSIARKASTSLSPQWPPDHPPPLTRQAGLVDRKRYFPSSSNLSPRAP